MGLVIMVRGMINRIGLCCLFLVFCSGCCYFSLMQSSCSGQVPVLLDDFFYLNPITWETHKFGSPDFNFTCGSWLRGASWLYVPVFNTGGSDPAYNGFHFVYTLQEAFYGEFTVETELGWSAPSNTPAFQIELRLLDASDNFSEDASWTIRLQCRDYWEASSCRPVASIEGVHSEGAFLPLEGSGTVRITRSYDFRVRIYWDDSLILEGISFDAITQICLRMVGRYNYPGAGGGFNYAYAYASSTDTWGPIIVPPGMEPFVVLGTVIIIIQVGILVYLIVRRKRIQRMQ